MKKIIIFCIAIAIVTFANPLYSQDTLAQEIISPHWSSDRIIEERGKTDNDAVVITFRSKTVVDEQADVIKSGTARLWSDADQLSIGDDQIVTDYRSCRVYTWNGSNTLFSNDSCYAGPTFRNNELNNRIILNEIIKTAETKEGKVALDDPFWFEQEFATQNEKSKPLTRVKTEAGIEWRLGDIVATKTIGPEKAFAKTDRKRFMRFFSRYLKIHPQVRRAIIKSGKIPSRIIIKRRSLTGNSTETISFLSIEKTTAGFPLPPKLTSNLVDRSNGDSYEAVGLRQTLRAMPETAQTMKPTLEQLLDQFENNVEQERALETSLTFLKLTQLRSSELLTNEKNLKRFQNIFSDARLLMEKNEAAQFMQASNFASSKGRGPEREAAALYIANADNLDKMDFGTFRYVTFANLLQISDGTKDWDQAIFEKMPSLTDNYWIHIAAAPWASNTYFDLGNAWYSQFEMFRAWQAWDLARAVDPDWQEYAIQSITSLEANVKASKPDHF